MDFRFEPRKLPVPITTIAAVVCVLIVGLFSMRLGQVKASEVGILINNVSGKCEVILNPGKFFYNGLLSTLHTMDKTRRTLRMLSSDGEEVRIKTSDGSDVRLDVEINYEILKDSKTIASKVLPESGVKKVKITTGSRRRATRTEEAYQSKWIRDYSRAVVRYVFGDLTTIEFYEAAKRDDKARETERELNRLLEPHGLRVTKVVPDKFRFYEEYERKIREKKEADQEKEKQKELAKAALKSQEYKVVQADKAAEVQIERTKGSLKKQLIAAEAEAIKVGKAADAYAYSVKVEAEAKYYSAERKAKGILAAARAEAEGLTNLVAALDGEGGRNLVLRALAEALAKARFEGMPYATSPVVQRVSVENAAATTRN